MQVAAVSTPQDGASWRWRIVNYAGEIVEESRETFTTIASAIEHGSRQLAKMDGVDKSVPQYHRSTRHLRVPWVKVAVFDNQIEAALKQLKKQMLKDGLYQEMKRRQQKIMA